MAIVEPMRIEGQVIWDLPRCGDPRFKRVELADLIRFNDAWYCGFHEGVIHTAHPLGRGRVIRSRDGRNWESVACFQWDGADVREPRLSVTAEGLLLVNTRLTFISEQVGAGRQARRPEASQDEPRVTSQSVTWLSRDGTHWSGAHCCPTGVNNWRWDVSWHGGMGYSVGYVGHGLGGTLYRTRDGRSWRTLRDNDGGNFTSETSIAFDQDHTAYALVRDARLRMDNELGTGAQAKDSDGHAITVGQASMLHGSSVPLLGIGKAPDYQDWIWRELLVDWDGDGSALPVGLVLRAPFGGPKMIRLSDGRFFVTARVLGPGSDNGYITLFALDPATAVLTRLAECAGTTYGSVVEHGDRLWMSFAAQDTTAIYLGSMPIPK